MAYCPRCDHQYEAGIKTCLVCDDPLVDLLSCTNAPAVKPDDSWVVVGGVTGQVVSEVARGSLDTNNIPSVFLKSGTRGGTVAADWRRFLVGAAGIDSVIMVPREFGQQARYILESVLGDRLVEPEKDNPLT